MKKKFSGAYLVVLLIILCTRVPFNLMKSTISSANVEHLLFERKMGYGSVWYSFVDKSGGFFTTSTGRTNGYIAVIDYKQLIIQILIVTMIFIIIYLFLPNKFTQRQQSKSQPEQKLDN